MDPVIEVPNSALITMMPGTNHCHTDPPPGTSTLLASKGPNRARKTSGWIRENTKLNGSRSIGFSSRHITMLVSLARLRGAARLMRVLLW